MFREHQPNTSAPEGGSSDNASSTDPEEGKQPTYTTVGSIYKPKAVTPLQPPTRRPRTRRYPQPIRSPSGDTFFPFPSSLLSALPLGDKAGASPPTTAATLQQYTPLQQNYDRAVTPGAERERSVLAGLGMSASAVQSDAPSPTVFNCDDNIASEGTLATSRITVKGLTNLASYPNPVQKAAQMALARARTANLGFVRPETPSSIPSTTPDFSKERLAGPYGAAPATGGPPQPLTAGPPGQRPFRSSTLEALNRLPHIEDQVFQMQPTASVFRPRPSAGLTYNTSNNGFLSPFENEKSARIPDGPVQSIPDERSHGSASGARSDFPKLRPVSTPGPSGMATEPFDAPRRKVHDTLPPERIKKYYPNGFPSNYDGRYKPLAEDWHTKYPITEHQQEPSERASKINRRFYAGTEGLVKNMDQIVRDHNYRCLENKVGIIGEERERLRGSHIERMGGDGKVQPPPLSIEELNRMGTTEVTQPLINMAFATLLRYKEESESGTSARNAWPGAITAAEDAWVDSTDEGNTSFFSKPKEEELRKKKVPRRPRRGY